MMPYKDILVQLEAAASFTRYEIAAELAARAGGRLTGVYLKTSLINQYNNIGTIGYLPPEDLNRLIREHNQGQGEDAAKSAAILTKAVAAAKADGDWRVIDGDTPNDLIFEARHADLVILGPQTPAPAYNVHASPVDITLGGGGPVLITPHRINKSKIGERVLVAWNGSREAARALRDALPLLVDNAAVEVRVAHPKDAEHDTALLTHHLERHGYRPNIETVVDEGQSISEWLASEASRTECDLIVMGLYGHARFQEFVLGGVSRDMLHSPPLPLLISH
jgi:nucleotide-binding universal stress UspA family protein